MFSFFNRVIGKVLLEGKVLQLCLQITFSNEMHKKVFNP